MAAMEHKLSAEESTLCEKCCVLNIDDKELAIHGAESDYGKDTSDFFHEGQAFQQQLNYTHYDLLPDLPHLRDTAEAGCAFCAMLRSAVLDQNLFKPARVTFSLTYIWRFFSASQHDVCTLHADMRVEDEEPGSLSLRTGGIFEVDCKEGDCQRWLRTELAPWAETLCEANVAWMKGLLDQCDAECGSASASIFLPTRLVDLGDSSQGGSICLIESSDAQLQRSTRYAALSYCWGTKEQAARQLTTTLAVLAQRLDGILFDEMTPVMQDMVKTARALSIRYIWVDALCIIQDDMKDWTYEAERMGSVYANAFVTICAVSTSSCLDSFLDRPAPPVTVAFQSSSQPGLHGHLELRPERPVRRPPGGHTAVTQRDKDLNCGAWSLRAWTLQEKEMSQRLLYFGARRVHFSCPTRRITEMEPFSSDRVSLFSHQLRRYKQREPDVNILRDWHRLIGSYVNRQSTKSKDRFAAIAGLAKLMAEATKWTYVAGMWNEALLEELFWSALQWDDVTKEQLFARSIARTPDTYIGPSWSWTHCCYIRFGEFNPTRSENPQLPGYRTVDFRSECHHLEATCTSEGASANPYGRLTDSKLQIVGKIIKPDQSWRREDHDKLTLTYGPYVAECEVDWKEDHENIELDDPGVSLLLLGSDYGPIDFHYLGDRSFDSSEGSSRILQFNEAGDMTEESVRDCELPGNRNAHGLLIHPIDGGARYIRVGLFQATEVGALLPFMERPFEDVEIV